MDYLKFLEESDKPIGQGQKGENSPIEYLDILKEGEKKVLVPKAPISPTAKPAPRTGSVDYLDLLKESERKLPKYITEKEKPKPPAPDSYVDVLKKGKQVHLIEQIRKLDPDGVEEYLKAFRQTEEDEEPPTAENAVREPDPKTLPTRDLTMQINELKDQMSTLNKRYGTVGGGGGTNAVQYANGGTMNGNLTVNGTLSAKTYAGISSTTQIQSVWVHLSGEEEMTGSLSTPMLSTGEIQLNTEKVPGAHTTGALHWHSGDSTASLGMLGSEVELQLGQENLVYVKNSSGVDIGNGKIVQIAGATGNNPTVQLADKTSIFTSQVIGIATEDIANDSFGYVCTFGIVNDVDTSNIPVGRAVWLGLSGNSLSAQPTSPDIAVVAGVCLRQHANVGKIFVTVDIIPRVQDLSDVNITSLTNNDVLTYSTAFTSFTAKPLSSFQIETPIALTTYDPAPARASVSDLHGGLDLIATGDTVSSGAPADFTKGTGKFIVIVNAGTDVNGTLYAAGDIVDRNTGVITREQSVPLTIEGLSTDNSTVDGNGNTIHNFLSAYITPSWFTGTVRLSTTDLNISDMDIYHVSFEQVNDSPNLVLNTFDTNLFTTNALAQFDAYLYSLVITPGTNRVTINNEASLNVGTDGETAIVNRYWRLRRGNIDKSLNGTTDGLWAELFYSNSPAYIEDVNTKIWLTKTSAPGA